MADKKQPLELEPKLKIKRLNRLAILMAAAGGILVLWVIYFALNTQPQIGGSQPKTRPTHPQERLALDRLEQLARERAEPVQPPPLPPSPLRRERRNHPADPGDAGNRRVLQRLAVALDSKMSPATFRGPSRESRTPDPSDQREREPLPDLGDLGLDDTASPRKQQGKAPVTSRPTAALNPGSPLQQGTLIPAVLSAGIHSELPGQTMAIVRQNVYDTTTGQHLLIPQGTRLLGSYDHKVVWGQKRILLAWNRLLFPDGRSLQLDAMPGVDLAAMSGLHDQVNNHFIRTFGSAILLSAISAGTQLSQPQESADGGAPSARQVLAAAVGQELGRTATEITRRNLDVRPTLVVRPGFLFHVEVTADLDISVQNLPGALP